MYSIKGMRKYIDQYQGFYIHVSAACGPETNGVVCVYKFGMTLTQSPMTCPLTVAPEHRFLICIANGDLLALQIGRFS
jgi:hypothetical protein